MSRFRNILVYAQAGDPDSLEQVVELAERDGAALTLCDVIEPPPAQGDTTGLVTRLRNVSWQLAFERLQKLSRSHKDRISLDYTVLTGTPFLVITEQVIRQGFDLVVHLFDPAAGVASGGLNPTGMHLMRKCPCAVWTLHPETVSRPGSVLLSVDRDVTDANARGDDLALHLAGAAAAVAPTGAQLHVVHSWKPYGAQLLQDGGSGLSDEETDAYLAATRQDHQQWFTELLERLTGQAPGLVIKPHLLEGEITAAVARTARDTSAELIVMGTIGTSAVPGVLIGTNAEAILQTISIPVLALKPTGFTTPLRFPARSAGDKLSAPVVNDSAAAAGTTAATKSTTKSTTQSPTQSTTNSATHANTSKGA